MKISNDCFIAALQKMLGKQGRGSKKKLAASVGVSPNHLSDILGKRKNAGQKLKERIADRLGMSFEDMLALGRSIIEDRECTAIKSISGNDFGKGSGGGALGQRLINTDDFLAMAAKILESDSPYRQALMNNLTAFHQAMETGAKEAKALQMIVSLQEELKTMRRDIEELKRFESGKENLSNSVAA